MIPKGTILGPRSPRVDVQCAICGAALQRTEYKYNRSKHKRFYCSRACQFKDFGGERNYRYKGGRFVCGEDGYVMIRIEGKWVFEHRHIMEQHLGRKLATKEVVHHKNGVVADNRIENLQVMGLKDHLDLHWEMKNGHPRGSAPSRVMSR